MHQSIVIPFHKNSEMLNYCLKRIIHTIPETVEIIIVGNNIDHKELDDVSLVKRCQYYKIYENLQYPKAVNYGVKKCSGEIVTIMDPDIFVLGNWYNSLLQKLESSPTIGAVGAKLINPKDNRILDFGMVYSKYNSAHTCLGLKPDHFLARKSRKVQAICSAILMTRKKCFEEVHGMDEDIPYSYTDCDYCLKLKEKGYDTWAVADAQAYHKGNTDLQNSKNYAFSPYHSDAKGMFGFKNYGRISYDMESWFAYTLKAVLNVYSKFQSKYILLDFSTVYDAENYYNFLIKYLNIRYLDKQKIVVGQRDLKEIQLHNHISYNYIDVVSPILYFVDTFTSLINNGFWFKMRNISNDIVVDRHGNILFLKDIATNKV